MDTVIYHAGCFDGFCAAWLCHKAWPDAEYIPCHYGEEPPDVSGKDVIIVDFSFKRPVLLAMKEKAKSLLVLDHHKTAEADLTGLDFCRFNMDKSGGRLTWEWLVASGVKADLSYGFGIEGAPWLVAFTEDRDLWRHQLRNTKEVNASLRTQPMEFSAWDDLSNLNNLVRLVDEGEGILRYQQKLIESHVHHAAEIELAGHKVMCVNCTCADLTSEVAGELAKDRPFGICWFETADSWRVYSLRSRDGGVDVSEIAMAHGGGGHRNAAGFRVPATGATGTFSLGQMDNTDEGDLRVAMAADKKAGVVRLDFGKPVAWLGLPKVQALEFAEKLRFKAGQLS